MNQTKQRIAIAEYCGYKNIKHIDAPDCLIADGVWADNPNHPPQVTQRIKVPDYINDLNAMHEAEEHLSTEEIKTYMGHLLDIMGISVWCITHVSAEQRAEAFLKTIGKWEE